MVGAGSTGPGGFKGRVDGGIGWGRGDRRVIGGLVGGYKKEPKTWDIQYCIKYIILTESSVPVASVLGLELHHPTMSTMWEHRYQSKIFKSMLTSNKITGN